MYSEGCIDSLCTPREVRINASSISLLSSPTSLVVNLSSDSLLNVSFQALVDSGSTHCFIESRFIHSYNISTRPVPPISLCLFDGTINTIITESVELPIQFPHGHTQSVDFFYTSLDSSCSVVLGHNWLTHCNPLIDWVLGSITFQTAQQEILVETPSVWESTPVVAGILPNTRPPDLESPHVALVDAATFTKACKLDGSEVFQLDWSSPKLHARSANLTFESDLVDLEGIPEDYHDFAGVFSKVKADTLAPHWPYNLRITLEDGASPPQPPIYLLSTLELETLQGFLDEHLNIGFIQPSSSLHSVPILFIKKKDGSLWLCVDFWVLNKVMKKDRYLLPLILDLLDVPHWAWIYSKIDLRHAYHLVCITDGDEWKMAFQTHYGLFKWLVMPFGLTNSPMAFQHFMNNILRDLLDHCIIVYLDDILVYSDNLVQHREHIW